jgi:hypothetical protein
MLCDVGGRSVGGKPAAACRAQARQVARPIARGFSAPIESERRLYFFNFFVSRVFLTQTEAVRGLHHCRLRSRGNAALLIEKAGRRRWRDCTLLCIRDMKPAWPGAADVDFRRPFEKVHGPGEP